MNFTSIGIPALDQHLGAASEGSTVLVLGSRRGTSSSRSSSHPGQEAVILHFDERDEDVLASCASTDGGQTSR